MERWSCERCFVDAKASRTLAMSVDPKKTEGILERIAAQQAAAAAAAAVPSPLPSIRRPRAWLSRAQVHTCTSTYIIHTHSTHTCASSSIHPFLHTYTHRRTYKHTDIRVVCVLRSRLQVEIEAGGAHGPIGHPHAVNPRTHVPAHTHTHTVAHRAMTRRTRTWTRKSRMRRTRRTQQFQRAAVGCSSRARCHPHKHALKVYIYMCVPVHKHLRLDQTPERIDEDIATESRRWPRVGACGIAVMRACACEAMLCLWSPPGRTAGLCRQSSTSRFRSQTIRCKRS